MDNINKKKEADIDAALTDAAIGVKDAVKDFNGMNYEDFTEGSDYASLAKRYNNMGKQAMKDTMGQASARTGGYANSYAVQAGQQAQNSFMEKLEDAARGLYDSQRQEKLDKVNMANAMYDRAYGEKQDYIANQQWQDTFDYQKRQDEEQRFKAAKEDGLNNLYTDLSLLSDDDFKGAVWDNYRESFEDAGLTEEDFNRYKKLVSSEKTASANAANAEMAEKNVQELEAELLNGGTFNPNDPRIPEEKQEYYYNFWKKGWKESALTEDATAAQIKEGNLSPAVLKSYEVYYGDSYCASELDDLNDKLLDIPTIALGSRGQRALATDGMSQELLKEVEKYVFAWHEYDAEGLNRYIESLDDESPIKVHLEKLVDDSSPPLQNDFGEKLITK